MTSTMRAGFLALTAIAIGGATLALSTPAAADHRYRGGSSVSIGINTGNFGFYFSDRNFRGPRYGYRPAIRPRFAPRRYARGIRPRPCHPVYARDYWGGYRAKVGATMCYDGYGRGYIVRGSRYLIHYYR